MEEKKFFKDLKRVCSNPKSSLYALWELLVMEEADSIPDFDAGDWCRKFCESHPNCEMDNSQNIHRFIKLIDKNGNAHYLYYDAKEGWSIKSDTPTLLGH